MARISIIIPHYDDLERLDRCLATLVAQQLEQGSFEIIVADNGSPQGRAAVEAVVAGRGEVVIAAERGAGPARNAGAARARGRLLAFIDSDCLADAGWLAAGCRALSEYDLVGGRMSVATATAGLRSGSEVFEAVFAFRNDDYVQRKGFSVTANLFCRREVLERVGGFATGVSEDVDWCHRATALGFQLGYASDAHVSHPARGDWNALVGKWARLNSETFALMRSRGGSRLGWIARTSLAIAAIPPHGWRMLRAPGFTLAERRRGLATLARLRFWRMRHALGLALRPE